MDAGHAAINRPRACTPQSPQRSAPGTPRRPPMWPPGPGAPGTPARMAAASRSGSPGRPRRPPPLPAAPLLIRPQECAGHTAGKGASRFDVPGVYHLWTLRSPIFSRENCTLMACAALIRITHRIQAHEIAMTRPDHVFPAPCNGKHPGAASWARRSSGSSLRCPQRGLRLRLPAWQRPGRAAQAPPRAPASRRTWTGPAAGCYPSRSRSRSARVAPAWNTLCSLACKVRMHAMHATAGTMAWGVQVSRLCSHYRCEISMLACGDLSAYIAAYLGFCRVHACWDSSMMYCQSQCWDVSGALAPARWRTACTQYHCWAGLTCRAPCRPRVMQPVGGARLAHAVAHAGGQHAHKVLAQQDGHAVLLGGRLQARGHVDVGRKVARVNLVLRPDRALDRPAHMQPKAQPHLKGMGRLLWY